MLTPVPPDCLSQSMRKQAVRFLVQSANSLETEYLSILLVNKLPWFSRWITAEIQNTEYILQSTLLSFSKSQHAVLQHGDSGVKKIDETAIRGGKEKGKKIRKKERERERRANTCWFFQLSGTRSR